jgi:hypothetical protein
MKGKRVYHPQYGSGVAQLPRRAGIEYQVRFDNQDVRWVRTDELELEEASNPAIAEDNEKRKTPPHFLPRKVIEALRLGIVPEEGVCLYTVGREEETTVFREWLHSEDEPSAVLIGPYGTGKTHLLRYFRRIALKTGYAVALVEMDATEAPFSKPKRVYGQAVSNLSWIDSNDREQGFRRLIQQGYQKGLLKDHHYFKHLHLPCDDQVWAWIEGTSGSIRPVREFGEEQKIPGLYDYTTTANIYCYLLSSLGWLCLSLGLKGLLILFDESEALYSMRGQLAIDRSVNFLDALVAAARNDPKLLNPAYDTGFTYAKHASEVPFLFRQPSGLKLMFAFTSGEDLQLSNELKSLPNFELSTLSVNDCENLWVHTFNLYQQAYSGFDFDINILARILKSWRPATTRALVKGLIEAFDICRFRTYDPNDDDPDDEW